MTSQLQIQKPQESATVTTATSPPQPVAAPIHQPPNVLSAAHTIEPELLGSTPRLVKPHNTESQFVGVLLSVMMVCTFWSLFADAKVGDIRFYGGIVCVVFWVCGQIYIRSKHFRNTERDLIRSGLPVIATVTKCDFYKGGYEVAFQYDNRFGSNRYEKVLVSAAIINKHGLIPGSRFTLLVSPDNDADVLPYFLASEYRIVPVQATDISRAVSAHLAEYDAQVAAKPVGVLGAIEPELSGATPRRARLTRAKARRLQLAMVIVAGFMTYLVLRPLFGVPTSWFSWHFFLCCLGGQIFVQLGLRSEHGGLNDTRYLHDGVPVRAFVTHEENTTPETTPIQNHAIEFSYKYESADSTVQSGSLILQRKRAWQLGLVTGATFTVLYNPKHPKAHKSYFQITDAEIVGAMGAKITPP